MTDFWQNNKLAIFAGIAVIIAALSTIIVVPETEQAVIVRFGEPNRVINRYNAKQDFGNSGAGIVARIPFVEQVVRIDKRVMDVQMEQQQVLSTDKLRLEVDAYARFRITNPTRMVTSAGSVDRVREQLQNLLISELRNELGKRSFASLLTPERGAVMERIRAGLDRQAQQYGARIIDVRIKRADLPTGTPLESALNRMSASRTQEAATIRAQGSKSAQIIRAEAEAEAARIYAASFGKDPDFYDFYRAMQSYQTTFLAKDDQTTMVLSPDNAYLRQFMGRGQR